MGSKAAVGPTGDPTDEVLKTLANKTNQSILNLLAVEAAYPRKVAELLELPETAVSRRLKRMEGMGLVVGEWSHIGKSVKLYRLVRDSVQLQFTPEGLRMDLSGAEGAPRSRLLKPLETPIPTVMGFVGRRSELEFLKQNGPVIVVEGLPGIGKTALLARYAHDETEQRPVFWHSFRGLESLKWMASRLMEFQAGNGALREALEGEIEPAELRERVLAAMDSDSYAVVLDDAHRIADDAVRSLLTDAIDRVAKGKLVVATRERPRFDPSNRRVQVLRLPGLDDAGMDEFLRTKGEHVDRKLLPRIREEVGGHPLALNLLIETARVLEVPLVELLDRIPEKDLEQYLLREIDEHLSETERAVLVAASVFRAGFALDDLRALVKRDPEPILFKLRQRLLVEDEGDGYALHETVRNFFHNLLADKGAMHEKAAAHFLEQDTVPGRLEAMHHLLEAGKRDRVLKLLEEDLDLPEFDVIDSGYQNLYLSILELFDRKDVLDDAKWALIEDEKGDIHLHRGEADQALKHYDQAVRVFEKAKKQERLADLAWKRALAHEKMGRKKEAAGLVEAALRDAPKGKARQRLESLSKRLAA